MPLPKTQAIIHVPSVWKFGGGGDSWQANKNDKKNPDSKVPKTSIEYYFVGFIKVMLPENKTGEDNSSKFDIFSIGYTWIHGTRYKLKNIYFDASPSIPPLPTDATKSYCIVYSVMTGT